MPNVHRRAGGLWLVKLAFLPVLGLTAQAQNSVTNGVVAYWNFDKQDFKDSVGKFDGTGNGTTPIAFVAGKAGFGQAIQLDGVDEFIEITGRDATYNADDLAFPGGSITIAGWFTVGTFDKSWQALIAKGESTNWRVHRNNANPTMAYAGGVAEGPNDGPDVTDGNWHHFAAVSDATAANFGTCIYIDGVQTSVNPTAPVLITNGKNMKIGDNPDATGRYWNGKVDDLAIWNRVLTETEIKALYNNGAGKPLSSFFTPAPPGPLAVSGTVPSPGAPRANFRTPISISFQNGTTKLDTNSVSLKLDNTAVTPTNSVQGDIITYTYQPTNFFAALSSHSVSVSYADTTGARFSTNWTFIVQNYPTLDPGLIVTPDTTKSGFIWEMSQVDSVGSYTQNSNARTIAQLAGLIGPNLADPSAQGVALAPGKPNSNPNLPVDFEISTVINLSASGNTGDFPPGDPMPGSPGTGGGTDNQAGRAITYVDLPAGPVTMGVNSDDGFATSAGYPNDAFAESLGAFDGGRGTADTLFTFVVPKAGVYPLFTIWENGGGGSAVTWFSVNAAGKKVLLNDSTNGGFKAYRARQGLTGSPAYVQSVSPGIGASGVTSTSPIQAVLVDGANQIDPASVTMTLDGSAVKPTVNKTGTNTTVTFTPTARYANGSQHTVALTFADKSTPPASRTATWSFTVATPPPPGATAFSGATKVGVAFDVDLDPATAGNAANYKVNGAAVTSAIVRTNVANELTSEKNLVQLTVATPITANFKVSVSGLKDALGGAYPSADIPGTIINLTSTDIGSPASAPGGPDPLVPSTVTAWGPGNYDVLCNGNDYWNNADGFHFLWAPKTNSFDVKVRVVSVSPIDNWSAGAIEVRDAPPTAGDFANGHGWELSRHYFCKVDYGGPTPSIHGTGSGANTYEFNCRKAPGDPTVRETGNTGPGESYGWGGTGPGNPSPVPYPNAWIRIARVQQGTNDHLLGYSSSDGVNWSLRQDVDLNDTNHAGFADVNGKPAGKWPDVCYVGLGSTSHTGVGNPPQTNDGSVGSFWYSPTGQPFQCYVIYRDYGDVVPGGGGGGGGAAPLLSFTRTATGLTLTFDGTLQSADQVTGPWTDVAGASPQTVTTSTGMKFYRAKK